MCHVAAEMERQGFDLPLLIGGATTSRVHTAVKINPNYQRGQTVYVTDASRAVGVASQLMSRESRGEIRRRHPRANTPHRRDACARPGRQAAAVARRTRAATRSSSTGRAMRRRSRASSARACSTTISIAELIDVHRLVAVLHHLGAGRKIPGDPRRQESRRGGALALRRRAEDAEADRRRGLVQGRGGRRLLAGELRRATISSSSATPRGKPIATLHTLRQQLARREGRANVALADFVAPQTRRAGHIGAFVVTAGIGEDAIADRFKHANDDYSSIMVKALADRLAEAFAERMHQSVRKEFWGYAADETLSNAELIAREIPRHPPGAGLSGAARPHREGHAVPAARRRADRREADRELRDVAGRLGVRALFQPPGEPLLRRRQDRARPGRGLRARARAGRWREAERWLAPILNYDPLAVARDAAE